MAVVNGNDIGIYVNGTLIGCLTNAAFSSSKAEIDVTCKDDGGDAAFLSGGKTSTITFDGLFKPESTFGLTDLFDIYDNNTEVDCAIGDQANLTIYSRAELMSLNFTGPLNAGTTFNGEFKINGSYTKSTT